MAYIEDLASHLLAKMRNPKAGEVKKIIQAETELRTAHKYSWYLKKKLKKIIDHLLILVGEDDDILLRLRSCTNICCRKMRHNY